MNGLRLEIGNNKAGVNMASNRRLSERIPFRKRVKYGLSGHALAGYTFNLSEDGIGIKANRVFSPRSKILVQIYISGTDLQGSSMDEIIKLEGTVAWVSYVLPGIISTMGIKFSNRSNDIKRIYLQRTN
jgi:PilZ domain